ncbi:MAG: acetate--CoA ligase [Patescibacteria group bacterium]|nr:acetate--CoA ligase [Patescibacteria group bacterium]
MTEEVEIIKKTDLGFEPNLKNYDETYKNFSWDQIKTEIIYFDDGKMNAAYNAIDKHLETPNKQKMALIWENDAGEVQKFTFAEIAELSNRIAGVLKKLGVQKGDRVFLFLPRIPELYYSFLGILKTGAIAGTLFQAFGPEGIKDRLGNSKARFVITHSTLVSRVEQIKNELPDLEKVLVVDAPYDNFDFKKETSEASEEFEIAHMDPKDRAFMLYTSGTTGKPKGVVHAHQAIIQEYLTAKWVLDIRSEDMYWCTADPGWVTGIAYEILGSWANAATALVFDGRFDPEKWYSIIDKYNVTIWYTAPTAIRMLMKAGDEIVKKYSLESLRHLASVGEPLNPEAIRWAHKAYKRPFHDNWWQTETGAICISNYPCMNIKVGSMGRPFPGVVAGIVDDEGSELPSGKEGNLALKPGWPSMMMEIWENPEKYQSYFKGDWYTSGDRAWQDVDGYFWFMGRADDVIKTAGERVGPFEVESALIEHPAVAEAGVIGKPDPERGEIIKAFCVLRPGFEESEELKKEIAEHVKKHLAGHAYPKEVAFVKTLPKTRSGKIMRRVLRAKELGLPVGDTSTLEEY